MTADTTGATPLQESRKVISVTVRDGVEITEYDDGSASFKTVETAEAKENSAETEERPSLWRRIKRLFKRHEVKPYVKRRDMSCPFNDGSNREGGGRMAYEAGVRFTW